MFNVVNNISNGVIIINTEGEILFLNTIAKLVGASHHPPLQIGGNLHKSVRLQWKEIVKTIVHKAGHTGTTDSLEANYVIDGKEVFFDVRCSPLYDTNGNLDRVMLEMRDITMQKIYEKKIRAATSDLSSLIETANAIVIAVDTIGYITEWNDYTTEVTGYLKSESLTKHFSEFLLSGESQEIFSKIITDALSGSVITNCELSINTKNFKKLNLLINAACRRNLNKEIVGVLVIGQDISELTEYRISLERKVRERTEELQKAIQKEKDLVEIKNRFVSIASHEFRSPLSVIKLQVDALKKILGTSEGEALERLDTIFAQADHMSALLEDILLTSKSNAGKIQAQDKPVELRSFLTTIIQEVLEATKNSHKIRLNFPADSLIIISDEKILRSIFINLLTNAIKFSPQQGEVFLNVSISGSKVELNVIDKGIGISPDDLERVFQPFNRGGNVQNINGTGLGLSIVKKSVEILNGKLWVDSTLNAGTKFTVELSTAANK
ncbi:MAG TPA: PAS domain-containing sensor histidine kinase [Cyclobacteriaceae bacterium]|nr:PAS domain-containing sensor histidine kinase [Cyclobacteriaceae bacterium]